MNKEIASSAYGPMLLVALEQTYPQSQRIVDDEYAYHMLPASMKLVYKLLGFRFLRRMLFNVMEKNAPGLWNSFPARKRYIEDKMTELFPCEMTSVVILGAGLDTLASRIPELSQTPFYEVDLPENITLKKRQLEKLYGRVPANTRLVPINFETQDLEQVLGKHGYSLNQKTLFIWEAVTQYLTEDAVRNTFDFLRQAMPGSRLIFTYVRKDFIDGTNTYGLDALFKRFRVNNQWWHFGLNPQDVSDFVSEYSWKVLEDSGAFEYIGHYLKPAGRQGTVAEIERIAYLLKE